MSINAQMGPSGNVVKLTPDTGTIAVTRSLWVGTAGAATMTDAAGNTLTNFPLEKGLNPLRVTRISSATASDIWALY